jgi:hypothetical protein
MTRATGTGEVTIFDQIKARVKLPTITWFLQAPSELQEQTFQTPSINQLIGK